MKHVYCGLAGNGFLCGCVAEIADEIDLRTALSQYARDLGFTVEEPRSKNGLCLGICEYSSDAYGMLVASYSKEEFLDVLSLFENLHG